MQCTKCTHNSPYIDIHVHNCRQDTSEKILFTTCTSGQVDSTRQTELSSGKCISITKAKIRHKPREGTSALHTV